MMCDYPTGGKGRYLKSLVVALAIFSSASNAAWQSNEPAGVVVTDFALAPSKPATVMATSEVGNRGIYISDTSGAAWDPNKENTQGYYGAAFKADNFNFRLAGVAGGVIRISVDNAGTAWADTNFSPSHDSWIIEFSRSSVSTVYAAGFSNGATDTGTVRKSTNASNMAANLDWAATAAIGGDLSPPTFSLAVAATDADIVYVGAKPSGSSNDGLYKTTDGAASWSYLSNLNITQVDALAVDPTNPNYVYAGTAGSGLIQRSVDGGANWVILHDPNDGGVAGFVSVRGLAINPADRRIIYAVGGSGATKVIASTDCGASWANVDSTGLLAGLPEKVLIDSIDDLVMVLTSTGAMYRESLLTNDTGDCNPNTGTSSSGGGSSSGSFDYLLLGMLMLIGVVRYGASRFPRS